MQSVQSSLIARDDTFLGICEGLGEDFGFSPNWLRLALGVALIASPVAAISTYLGLGVVVAATRWLVPNPRVAVTEEIWDEEVATAEAMPAEENDNAEALPVAA